jgi:hypothetical protein
MGDKRVKEPLWTAETIVRYESPGIPVGTFNEARADCKRGEIVTGGGFIAGPREAIASLPFQYLSLWNTRLILNRSVHSYSL